MLDLVENLVERLDELEDERERGQGVIRDTPGCLLLFEATCCREKQGDRTCLSTMSCRRDNP